MTRQRYFIIDFDSTFTQVEALEELAAISLRENPERDRIVADIKAITNAGMEGRLSITESLERRVALLSARREHLNELTETLKGKITPSFARNRAFLETHAPSIFILSAGFKEFVVPVAAELGVRGENVFANTFVFDERGAIIGLDRGNPLSREHGKAEQVRLLDLSGEVYGIGDGWTDYELKEHGLVSTFVAFTENVARARVVSRADRVARTFDDFLDMLDSRG